MLPHFYECLHVNQVELRCRHLTISEGAGSHQQSRAEQKMKLYPAWEGKAGKRKPSHHFTVTNLLHYPIRFFTLKPWYVKKNFQFYFILST